MKKYVAPCLLCLFILFMTYLAQAQDSLQTFEFTGGAEGSIDWSANGIVQAQGFGLPAPTAAFDAQKELTACRAAQVTAQVRLLEIIEGVSVYGGTSIMAEAGALVRDELQTNLKGVLVGAVELPGSRRWDAEKQVCELTMAAPLANIREAIPPLGISSEGKLVIVDGAVGPNQEAIEQLQEQLKTLEEQIAETQSETDSPLPESSQESAPTVSENTNSEPEQAPSTMPVAIEDRFTMNQGETLEASVLANDQFLAESVQVSLVGNVSQGALELRVDGSFRFQATGTNPKETFKYRLTDAGGSSEAFVIISITPVAPSPQVETVPDTNVPASTSTESVPDSSQPESSTLPAPLSEQSPVAQDDSYSVVAGGTVELDLFANDQSPKGLRLILGPFGNTQNGSLSLLFDGKGSYTSYNNGATSDSFTYFATDGEDKSNEATVTIKIIPVDTNSQTSPNVAPLPQSSQATDPAEEENGQGGQAPNPMPVDPAPTPAPTNPPSSQALPSSIIFDASGFSLTRSFKMKIESSSGITLYDNFKATYINNSLESAKGHEQAGNSAEVLSVFAVDPKGVNLILDQASTVRFLELLAQKDFGAENRIIIVRKDP